GLKAARFPFDYESGGTRVLLALFAGAYPVAAKSGVVSLDEIERGIHPHLLPELVKALTPPDTTSQLLLVSHCDYLLRHLEHDQVFLTEKQEDGSSDVYRADNVEDFKADRNLLNWYHAGKLGAIPRL
ncbi:MAG: ATP-binding protein, partial [Opitutaceae bacterium]|nr:ATP-binding protein [Opitutaceae bacterium]